MISKRLYLNIFAAVAIIVLLSVLLGYLAFSGHYLRYSLICAAMIILVSASLITYLNRTNRHISYFFNAVRNDDSNLTFPTDDGSANLRLLYTGMNNVNRQIQLLKLRNRQQEQYFGRILEHLATGILTYDSKGFIHHANTAARRLFSVDVLTHLQQLEKFDENLPAVIRSIKPFERRLVKINGAAGDVQLTLKTTSFRSENDELTILSIQDIRQELDEKEAESWMKLIRVLMHEIMNSITPITSLSESLSQIYNQENKPVTPSQISEKTISTTIKGLEVIREQGHGLMSFVESYRKLTNIPRPEKKLFRVAGLFSRIEVLGNLLTPDKPIPIIYTCCDTELAILADENLVSQVMLNLIKNAIEANAGNNNPVISVSACMKDEVPEICVSDNGPGISPEHIKEIFVPFFTTRENGSGIGLSISRQIMRAHGGHLTVRSLPGRETVFCMRFSEQKGFPGK